MVRLADEYFNPRSLAGATAVQLDLVRVRHISIHAPLRERPPFTQHFSAGTRFQSTLPCGSDHILALPQIIARFQSTLPCGSDAGPPRSASRHFYFNPRSLAGATCFQIFNLVFDISISIHAPLRERLLAPRILKLILRFQSTLPCGSDPERRLKMTINAISIHAPSRERPTVATMLLMVKSFQSTLPHGSDHNPDSGRGRHAHFNPRSLTGATRRLSDAAGC